MWSVVSGASTTEITHIPGRHPECRGAPAQKLPRPLTAGSGPAIVRVIMDPHGKRGGISSVHVGTTVIQQRDCRFICGLVAFLAPYYCYCYIYGADPVNKRKGVSLASRLRVIKASRALIPHNTPWQGTDARTNQLIN